MGTIRRAFFWRLASLLLLAGGLLTPWTSVGFEPAPVGPRFISGANYWLSLVEVEVEYWVRQRVDLAWILYAVEAISVAFALGYSVWRVVGALRGNEPHSSFLSLTLIGIVLLIWTNDFAHRGIIPSLGFWLFAAGLIFSAICEWRSTATDL